jgi:hypothetical protein
MIKYKICKFVNGNGEEWYQIKKKGWIFWSYVSSYKGGAPEFSPLRTIEKFYSMEQVQKFIKDDIECSKRDIIKKVECFDYE